MTPAQILALINAVIVSNDIGAITGPQLNVILTAIVNLFTTNPNTPQIVTASTPLTIVATTLRYGFQRTLSLAAMNAQLPALTAGQIGTEFVLQDLVGNFSAYPVTVLPPAGQTIVGRNSYVMNEDNQTSRFYFYGANLWGVEPA